MEFNFNKELALMIGKKVVQVGQVVIINGIQTTVGGAAATMSMTLLKKGPKAVKKLSFDEIIGIEESETSKKKWFSRDKDKTEELLEEFNKPVVTVEKVVEAPDYVKTEETK